MMETTKKQSTIIEFVAKENGVSVAMEVDAKHTIDIDMINQIAKNMIHMTKLFEKE